MSKGNKAMIVVWGMILVADLALGLYRPNYLQGIFAGLAMGMLISSIMSYYSFKLLDEFSLLTTRQQDLLTKIITEKEEKVKND